MKCSICSIGNKELLQEIEYLLEINNGILSNKDKVGLIEKYPAYKNSIEKINDQDCNMHWNFHQSVDRPVEIFAQTQFTGSQTNDAEKTTIASLTADIAKDEATILYEVLNTQAATFRCLDKKIKKAIEKVNVDEDMSQIVVNPSTVEMYNDITSSIRNTVREIREMNKELNGKGEDPLAGMKALAAALTYGSSQKPENKLEDMSTKEFDDPE